MKSNGYLVRALNELASMVAACRRQEAVQGKDSIHRDREHPPDQNASGRRRGSKIQAVHPSIEDGRDRNFSRADGSVEQRSRIYRPSEHRFHLRRNPGAFKIY
jgi:hypothetical protein